MCGEPSVSTYGTGSAARNWQKSYTDLLCNGGFRVTRENTCIFRHKERDIVVMVHGDDCVSTGDIAQGEVRDHDRHHRTRGREQETIQGGEQIHFSHRRWVHA